MKSRSFGDRQCGLGGVADEGTPGLQADLYLHDSGVGRQRPLEAREILRWRAARKGHPKPPR